MFGLLEDGCVIGDGVGFVDSVSEEEQGLELGLG